MTAEKKSYWRKKYFPKYVEAIVQISIQTNQCHFKQNKRERSALLGTSPEEKIKIKMQCK